MKNFLPTFIFAFVVVVLGGLVYWDNQNQQVEEQTKAAQQRILPNWNESQVNELKLVRAETSVHLKKENGQWKILWPIKDEAENSSVESMIRSMLSEKVEMVSSDSSTNWGKYGFEAAKRAIELVNSDTVKKQVLVSNQKTFDGQYYLRVADSDKLVLASGTWDSWLNKEVNDIRNKKVFPVGKEVSRILVSGAEKFELYKQKENWAIAENKDFKVDQEKLRSILNSIKNFKASEVVAEERNKKNLNEFKLLRPAIKLTFVFKDEKERLEFSVGNAFKDKPDRYMYSSDKPFVYKSSKASLEKWDILKKDLKLVPPKEAKDKKQPTSSK